MDLTQINEQEKKWLLREKYHGVESEAYIKEASLIDKGMPVAYLIGNIEFLGCHIDLSSRPLIPRAETEYWADVLTKKYKSKYSKVELSNLKALDVFAGSGCIGIALKKHLGCHVDFAELKPDHCEQIKENLEKNFGAGHGYQIFESDVLKSAPKKKYDLIVANPPYVPPSHKKTLVQDSVNKFEDPHAVYADDNGNALIKRLITQSDSYLSYGGELWIEFDPSQEESLVYFCTKTKNSRFHIIQDQFNQKRILVIKR